MVAGVSASANPTPLETADVASHVVASLNLFYSSLALGTVSYIVLFSSPSVEFELRILKPMLKREFYSLAASAVSMPLILTLETNLTLAFWTQDLPCIEICSFHIPITADSWAVSNQWIRIQLLLLSKLLELREYFRVAFE